MTRTLEDESLAPETLGASAPSPTACDSCGRPLRAGAVSRVFPTWHARCLDRAVQVARAEARDD